MELPFALGAVPRDGCTMSPSRSSGGVGGGERTCKWFTSTQCAACFGRSVLWEHKKGGRGGKRYLETRKNGQRWHPGWVLALKYPAKQKKSCLLKRHQHRHSPEAGDLTHFVHFSHVEIPWGSSLFLNARLNQFYCIVIVWQRIPGHGCLLSLF